MQTETLNATNVAQPAAEAATKKVIRRGIASARGTTRLKFSHIDANRNGLFLAHLDSINVSTILIGEETTGIPSFNGMEIPKLTITFASNEDELSKRRYVTLQFNAVESNANTIPGGSEDWKVTAVFDWLKHLMQVYVLKDRDFTEEEENALALNFEDFNEQGEYVPVEAETVIAAWKTLFENFENIMNRGRNGQPYYKTKDNKIIHVWLKLLRYMKPKKKDWKALQNGDLALPTFVGEGCVEVFKANTAPAIKLDITKEAIIPMKIEKAKAPNMPAPGMNSAHMIGGVPIGDTMGGIDMMAGISAEASNDMPFGDDFPG